MDNNMRNTILFLFFISLVFGQFKADMQRVDFPEELQKMTALESRSLLDPARFQMNHSFSVSMMSMGGISAGMGTYTNYMSFLLRDNLRLTTSFSLVKPTMMQNLNSPNTLDGQIYYGAQLEYQPSENTLFQLGFQTYPAYSYYNRPNYFGRTFR